MIHRRQVLGRDVQGRRATGLQPDEGLAILQPRLEDGEGRVITRLA